MADTNLIKTNNSTQNNALIVRNGSANKLSATNTKSQKYGEPPDRGARAILVMISAFFCNSILFGIINTWGTIYITLQDQLESHGDKEASSKACTFHNNLFYQYYQCFVSNNVIHSIVISE